MKNYEEIDYDSFPPDVSELAKLRSRVFCIDDNQLQKKNIVRTKDRKKEKAKVNTDSDSESQISDFLLFLIQN